MSKHTAGPWEIVQHDDYISINAERLDGSNELCALASDDNKNAALIAAAPELLEALEYAANLLDVAQSLIDGTDQNNMLKALTIARAAIAKAKGE